MSYHLPTLKLFQICMSFFIPLSTKYILNNVGNQRVDASLWFDKFCTQLYKCLIG